MKERIIYGDPYKIPKEVKDFIDSYVGYSVIGSIINKIKTLFRC